MYKRQVKCSLPDTACNVKSFEVEEGEFPCLKDVYKRQEYEDVAIDYKNPIYWLKQGGYEGYINSEYEGQRHQQDQGIERCV